MLALQYLIGTIVLTCFILSVMLRALMLRRQGIRALLFGETDKTDFILVPCVIFVFYVVFANTFGWPIWEVLVTRFWVTELVGWIGLALCAAALVFFLYSLVCFGKSFRVGIDEKKPAKLVTSGAFALSRNPIYVCFIAFFCGLFLVQCNMVLALAFLGIAAAIHRQILREEAFLSVHYGQAYTDYRAKVRRYL